MSLNLAARKEERTRLDKERLDRENGRRTAKGLPALKTVEELDAAEPADGEIVLVQATEVMGDMVVGIRPTAPGATPDRKTAKRT